MLSTAFKKAYTLLDSPSAIIVIVYFFICGALAFIPGTIPFEYSKPTQQNYEKCLAATQVSDPEQLKIYDAEQLKSDWCSIAAITNQSIKIIITEHAGPAVRYNLTQTNELVLDRLTSTMTHSAFMFMLAHEYEHHRISHGFYRNAYNCLLVLTIAIGIFAIFAFALTRKHEKILLLLFIPIATYIMFFNAFNSHEIQADKGAYKHLTQLGQNANAAANSLLSFGIFNNLDKANHSVLSLCLFANYSIDLHSCDPHPTNQERKNYFNRRE